MIRLRAITWAMGIWATAFAMLLAGLPRLQCCCPDGRIKPFCWSILFPSTCCLGVAAPAAEQQSAAAAKPCCCCQASRQAQRGEQVGPTKCQKTIVIAPIASPSDVVRYSAQDFVSPLLDGRDAVPFVNVQPESGRGVAVFPWSVPSTDLVIALRHLLV